jgi:hypothetical protein
MSLPAENVRQIEGPTSQLPVQSEGAAVLGMIERVARDPGADMDKMMQLMSWRKEIMAEQKRAAFDEAISAAKAEIPVIIKNRSGHNNKYEDMAAIAAVVDPILGRHGLSYRFRTAQTEKSMSITCVLFGHGHSEETTLTGPFDATVGKNPIQAIGSTQTYLQRYTLKAALGLAASEDDDGRSAGASGTISLEQVEQLLALADEVEADKEAFCRYFKVDGIAQLKAKDFDRAIAALNKKRKA